MFYEISYVYCYFIFSIISITFLLVILRRSWGIIPRLYVHGLILLQEKFSPVVSKEPPAGQRLKIIQRRHSGRFIDRITANHCHNEKNRKGTGLLELETELLQAGVEAIIQVTYFLKMLMTLHPVIEYNLVLSLILFIHDIFNSYISKLILHFFI